MALHPFTPKVTWRRYPRMFPHSTLAKAPGTTRPTLPRHAARGTSPIARPFDGPFENGPVLERF
jgi:hypothetical protein